MDRMGLLMSLRRSRGKSSATLGAAALAASLAVVLGSRRAEPVMAADMSLEVAATRSDTLNARLAEARARVVPALGERGVELGDALERLSSALAAPDRLGLADAVAGVDGAVGRLRSAGAREVDLGVVPLVQADARLLVPLVGLGRR